MAQAPNVPEPTGVPPYDLTGFQRDLLFAIKRLGDPYGLAIKELLEHFYPDEVRHGRMYPNLETLEDKGLISIGKKDKRTNEYRLTPRGERVLDDHREYIRWVYGDGEG